MRFQIRHLYLILTGPSFALQFFFFILCFKSFFLGGGGRELLQRQVAQHVGPIGPILILIQGFSGLHLLFVFLDRATLFRVKGSENIVTLSLFFLKLFSNILSTDALCCGSMTFWWWIWIRIRGSMPRTNGSGSCHFHH
jgi:hypothetical protein